MLLYYITDRKQFPGSDQDRCTQLIARCVEAARCGVDFIQIREKDLASRQLEALAHAIMEQVRALKTATRVLINSRTDIALASGADGVHLRSSDVSPADVRRVWRNAGKRSTSVIGVSCHTADDVATAKQGQADFAVFGPVFEKNGKVGSGIEELRYACRLEFPVLALGGVNSENAGSCLQAGAAGITAIRLFQHGSIKDVVEKLRGGKNRG